ncbi:MAG TPA: hypothetical protein VJB68_01305, partial [Methylophilaceae bacterium]|nr:hypothetical protein [Methylophilaceae bacterium]
MVIADHGNGTEHHIGRRIRRNLSVEIGERVHEQRHNPHAGAKPHPIALHRFALPHGLLRVIKRAQHKQQQLQTAKHAVLDQKLQIVVVRMPDMREAVGLLEVFAERIVSAYEVN